MTRTTALVLAAVVLAGCASTTELAQRDDATCSGYGFQAGTDAYAQCRERQAVIRMQRRQAFFAGMAAAGAAMRSTPERRSSAPADPSIGGGAHGIACFARGEVISGFNKVCTYDCAGSAAAITIGSAELCPITLNQ